jgi:soluble lytic murein transglycosylase-like protein
MKLTQAQANVAALIQRARLSPIQHTFWIPVSWMMAIVRIESGFDPTIKAFDYDVTGSVGLCQVTRSTAISLSRMYPELPGCRYVTLTQPDRENAVSGPILDQTDAYSSLVTGMLDLWDCRSYLAVRFKTVTVDQLIMAYNEGPGAVARGQKATSYWLKWASVQPAYVFLDQTPPTVLV